MTRAVPIPHSERNKTIMEEKQTAPALTLEPDLSVPAVPTLTLDPEPAPPAQEEKKPAVEPEPMDAGLSPKEKGSGRIRGKNRPAQFHGGAAVRRGQPEKSGRFFQQHVGKYPHQDLGEVGEMVTGLVTELKSFDATEEAPKGIMGFFRKATNSLDTFKAKYAKVETNVDKIEAVLEGHQVQLLKDIAMLDKMYEMNLVYFKELTMYILAGKKKLAEVRANELPALIEKAKKSGLPEDAQAAKDLDDMCTRFEKKLYDLELTRNISVQMSPQIRLIQSNDTMMAEKIQTSIVNTIPLWKSHEMVLALGLAHSQQAIEAQRAVTDMTNELLKKNAATLKQGTIAAAKESERGIVDIETLQQTNRSLIETLDEVVKIQNEGREKRAAAETELGRIEGELKAKLLEIAR